jgi:glycosyltransferase involved in cell wall biosynthesis
LKSGLDAQIREEAPTAGDSAAAHPLRITHVIDSLQIGGAEVMVASLARIQKRRGAQVRIICFSQIGALEATVRNDGVEIYRCRRNPVGASAAGKLSAVLELRRELRAWRTDIVHCHDIPTTLYGAPAARLAGVRGIFCTRHSCRPDVIRNECSFWRVMRLCDRAVAVSESVQDTLTALPYARAAQIVTIRNGVARQPVTSPPGARRGFTLVTVARLSPPKDHATLLRAVARAAGECPELRLLVVGGGPLEGELRALAQELGISACVEFPGERQDIGNWLARADCFVLSSRSEGLPMSMLEAMAAGLPMILSDVGGIREVVEGLPAVALVPPEDSEALAGAILDFSARRRELSRAGEVHRRHFEEHYSAECMADAYSRLYFQQSRSPIPPSSRG